MARHLVDRPGGLTVCDVVPEATAWFAERGATVAATPAEVAEHATVISLMVRDDAQVTEVLTGERGILSTARPGTIVAIHSTVEADTPARLAAVAAAHDVHVVDAPVSGSVSGARSGQLAFMVGGDEAVVAALTDAFAHLGPVGAGTRAKLARNLITNAAFVAVGEAVRLAEAAGVDLQRLGDVVRHSDKVIGGPGMVMLRPDTEVLADDDGLRPIFEHTRDLGEKDLALALALGRELGVDMPVAAQAHALLGAALGVPHPAATAPRSAP
jgi:3-hydroxyisobutyrate dehydrogenase